MDSVHQGAQPDDWSTVCFVGMVIAAARTCVRRRRKASAGQHTAKVPTPGGLVTMNARLNSLVDEVGGMRRRKYERRQKAEDVRFSMM